MKYNFRQIRKGLCAVLMVLVTIAASGQVSCIKVMAGASDIVIDNTSFKKAIDTSKWNVPSGDVTVEAGKLIFSKESTEDTKLITMEAAKVCDYNEELFRASYTLKIKNIAEGQKFVAGFSLADVESSVGEAESLEIAFMKASGLKVSVATYDENGKKTMLVNAKSCNLRENIAFKLDVIATKDMGLQIMINDQKLYDAKATIDLAGRMGFLQTGSCAAEISEVTIVCHEYDRPENANITEDFENGTINYNTLTSKMVSNAKSYPNGIQVEDYQGNKVLMFRSVAMGYLGTKYTYSNFEISFDIPYMQHKTELNEEGQIVALQNSAFVVGIGDDAPNYDKQHGYLSSAEGVVFSSTEVASLNNLASAVKLADKNLFDEDKHEGYSVKISVIDAEVTVYVKALRASQYEKLMQYKLGNATPTGYVHFFANGQSNFAIDNLTIENKDQDAKILNVEYKDSFLTGTEDWKYEPEKVVYLEPVETEKGFNIALIPVFTGVVSIIMVAVCFVATKRKKTEKERGELHE